MAYKFPPVNNTKPYFYYKSNPNNQRRIAFNELAGAKVEDLSYLAQDIVWQIEGDVVYTNEYLDAENGIEVLFIFEQLEEEIFQFHKFTRREFTHSAENPYQYRPVVFTDEDLTTVLRFARIAQRHR